MELNLQLLHWHWWVIGLVLVVIEALLPSGMWAAMAMAAISTGAAAWLIEGLAWQFQLGIFCTLLLIFIVVISIVKKRLPGRSEKEGSADSPKAKAYIGKDITLTGPIKNGFGEVQMDEIWWSIKGPDLKKGTKVRVIGTDAGMLSVLPLPNQQDNNNH